MKKQLYRLGAASLLLVAVLVSGCGLETEKADELIRSANDTIAAFQPKLVEVEGLLLVAREQAGASAGDDITRLETAQALTEEVDSGIREAKSKIDEAASLNIEEQKRSYLEAKSKSLDIMLSLNETMSELVAILIADPTTQNPETLPRWAELVETMNGQSRQLLEAETEASKIVEANGE